MENLWEMIAKERGVELGEEFIWRVKGRADKCKITLEQGLLFFAECVNTFLNSMVCQEFIAGEGEITKLPFVPKHNETYWTVEFSNDNEETIEPHANMTTWWGFKDDYLNKMTGLVFRTKEEAESYLPTFKERLKEVGWIEKKKN